MKYLILASILLLLSFNGCHKFISKNEPKAPFEKMYIVSYRMYCGSYYEPENIRLSLSGCMEINHDFSATVFNREDDDIGSYPLPLALPLDFKQKVSQLVDRYSRDSAYYKEAERPEVSNYPSYALVIQKENGEYIRLGGGDKGRGLPDDIQEVLNAYHFEVYYMVDVSKLTPDFFALKEKSSMEWYQSKQDSMQNLLVDLYFNSPLYKYRFSAHAIRKEKETATN